jgi:hypothetical protein
MPNYMTKKEVETEFRTYYMPAILRAEAQSGGGVDGPMRREEWNNYTDYLCKDGRISDAAYSNWTHPRWLESDDPSACLGPNWKSMLLGGE